MISNSDITQNSDRNNCEPAEKFQADSNAQSTQIPDIPYKGLNPYSEADSALFFGRDRDIQSIANHLRAWPLTILYGESGVGKSSVLRAGVTHALQEEAQQNLEDFGVPKLAVVVFPPLKGERSWRNDPLQGLMQQIEEDLSKMGLDLQAPEPGLSLLETLKIWVKSLGSERSNGKLLIILDQFEEYFLYHSQRQEKDPFVEEFATVLNCPDLRVNFLISLREDSLAKLDRFQGSIPKLFDILLRIEHLDDQSARDAIVKPIQYYVEQCSRQIKLDPTKIVPEKLVDPNLVDQVIEQVKRVDQQGGGLGGMEARERPIEAPYLQLIMERLWQNAKITPENIGEKIGTGEYILHSQTLEELGGTQKIFEQYVQEKMGSLEPHEKDVAAALFVHLITPTGTKIAYSVADLENFTQIDKKEIQSLLKKLDDQRILRSVRLSPNSPELGYEIFHDRLAPAILKLRQLYLHNKELNEAKFKHAEALKKEERKRKKLWITIALILPLTLGIAGVALYLFNINRALSARKLALRVQEASQQFQSEQLDQLDALVQAMGAGQELKNMKDPKLIYEYASNFSDNLRQILDNIQEKYKEKIFDPTKQATTKQANVRFMQLSQKGDKVAILSTNGRVFLKDPKQSKLIELAIKEPVLGMSFNHDGQILATVSQDGTVCLWNLQDSKFQPEKPLKIIKKGFKGQLYNRPFLLRNTLRFSADGNILATASTDGTVRLWNLQTSQDQIENPSKTIYASQKNDDPISYLRFSPQKTRKILATASRNGTIRLWDWQGNEPQIKKYMQEIEIKRGSVIIPISSLNFSPNGKMLAIASRDAYIHLWALKENQFEQFAPPKFYTPGIIFNLRFSPKGQMLATASRDGNARLWDLKGNLLADFLHENAVLDLRFNDNGQQLDTVSAAGMLHRWRLTDLIKPISKNSEEKFSRIFFSPSGDKFTTISASGVTCLQTLPSPAQSSVHLTELSCTNQLKIPKSLQFSQLGLVSRVQYSPSEKRLVTLSFDGKGGLWDLQGNWITGFRFKGASGPFGSISFSPDERQLWIVSRDNDTLYHCNLIERESQINICQTIPSNKSKEGNKLGITSMGFGYTGSADRRKFVIVFTDGEICLGNIQDLKDKNKIDDMNNCFNSHISGWGEVKFSPNDQTLGFASMDGKVHLWNVQGKPQELLQGKNGQEGGINASAGPLVNFSFSPNSQNLATVSLDGRVSLWDLQGQQLATFRDNNQESMILNASFMNNQSGQWLVTASDNGTLRFRPVEDLDQLMQRGCDWLKDYLATHPEEQKKLSVCRPK